MVSNFERIFAEIRKEAKRVAPDYQLKPETAVKLIMEAVDLEDGHRVRAESRINQRIKGMIQDATQVSRATERQ